MASEAILNHEETKTLQQESDNSLFVQRIIDGAFFEEENSQKQDYTLVVNHCLSHTDEEYDETFAYGLSQMLVQYPHKIEGIQQAIRALPQQ